MNFILINLISPPEKVADATGKRRPHCPPPHKIAALRSTRLATRAPLRPLPAQRLALTERMSLHQPDRRSNLLAFSSGQYSSRRSGSCFRPIQFWCRETAERYCPSPAGTWSRRKGRGTCNCEREGMCVTSPDLERSANAQPKLQSRDQKCAYRSNARALSDAAGCRSVVAERRDRSVRVARQAGDEAGHQPDGGLHPGGSAERQGIGRSAAEQRRREHPASRDRPRPGRSARSTR